MEFSIPAIPDHSTIDRDELVLCIFICLTNTLLGEFEDFSILEHDDLVLCIAEIIGIASVASEHMGESIDRDIVFWCEERDHLLRIFFLRMSSRMDL